MNQIIARLDFETLSELDIQKDKYGPYKYAEHPSTKVNTLSWKYSNASKMFTWCRWRPRANFHALMDLCEFIEDGGIVKSHNVEFELAVWNLCFVKQIKNLKGV